MPILHRHALTFSGVFAPLLCASFALADQIPDGPGVPGAPTPIDKTSVINENSLRDIESVRDTTFYDMAKPVARVENFSRDGFCTGFRVAETLFLTNYHCWDAAGCRMRFRMGYERRLPASQQAMFECTTVLDMEEHLDFAIVRVRPLYDQQAAYPVATLSRKPLTVGMSLLAPGHPILKPKQIDTSAECKLTRAIPYDYKGVLSIQHQCDTEGGSSGSPLIDRETGHVVGIHWGSAGATGSNHAVPMGLILDHLKSNDPVVYDELTVVDE